MCLFARARAHPPLIAAPAEACAAANPWSGVVRGAKVVVKRGAGVLWRRLPVARRLGLNVPVGAKRGAYGLLWLLLNFSLGPFLGGVLSVCESFHSESARYHFFPKNDPLSLFGFCLPSTVIGAISSVCLMSTITSQDP